jgi:hypothetical protein
MAKVYYEAGKPIPEDLGTVVDHFKEVQALRLAMDKEVKAVKDRENELKDFLIENIEVGGGAFGLKHKAEVTREEKPTVEDWEAIHEYVLETGDFNVMGRSLNSKTIEDMWEEGETIDGVGSVYVKKISITKRGK